MVHTIKQFPHCDSSVLHAPGTCDVCDKHPEWQALREAWSINFTGQKDPNKLLCPSQWNRPLATIEAWPGNRAHKDSDGID